MHKIILFAFLTTCLSLVGCSADNDASFSGENESSGVSGSYARFITMGNFLYIVDQSDIQTFSLSDPTLPQRIDKKNIGEQVESIFNYGNRLFIGSGSGLYIYTIQADGIPTHTASFDYDFPILPCDPVVANETHAFVTLHDGDLEGPCGERNIVNELRIFDISDIESPQLIRQIPMTRPKGLGLDGNILFVCDDMSGLRVFDVSTPEAPEPIAHLEYFNAFDVIPLDGLLLCVGPDNVYQFDYTNLEDIQEISRIEILP